MTIWKYQLKGLTQTIMIPGSGKALAVGAQGEDLVMWVMLDPEARPVARKFEVFGTGVDGVTEMHRYIGTAQIHGLVWHVFEKLGATGVGLGEGLLDSLEA